MLQIHERLRQARIAANLSQGELAEKIGVSRTTYQYWEKVTPGIDEIKRVAAALGLPEDAFLKRTEDRALMEPDDVLPLGSLRVTLADYVQEIKDQRSFLQRIVESSLVRMDANLADLVENLLSVDAIPDEQTDVDRRLLGEADNANPTHRKAGSDALKKRGRKT